MPERTLPNKTAFVNPDETKETEKEIQSCWLPRRCCLL